MNNDDRAREFLEDPDFQKHFLTARDLEWDEVEKAFRHGFDSRDRFADRPFDEVDEYLRKSWEGMETSVSWDEVRDIVASGYSRYKGAGFGPSTDLATEALDNFPTHDINGTHVAGRADRLMRPDEAATPTTDRPAGGTGPIPEGAPDLPEGDAGTSGRSPDRTTP